MKCLNGKKRDNFRGATYVFGLKNTNWKREEAGHAMSFLVVEKIEKGEVETGEYIKTEQSLRFHFLGFIQLHDGVY